MSRENVEIVRSGLEVVNRTGVRAFMRQAATAFPEFEIDWSESVGPQRGVYRGLEQAVRFAEEWSHLFEQMRIEPEEFIDAGESVVVPNTAYLRGRNGVEVQARSAFVYVLHDKKLHQLRLYQSKDDALAAVGLRESAAGRPAP